MDLKLLSQYFDATLKKGYQCINSEQELGEFDHSL